MKKSLFVGIICFVLLFCVSGCGKTYEEKEDTVKIHKKVLDKKLGDWKILKTGEDSISHAGFGEQTKYKTWKIRFYDYSGKSVDYELNNYNNIDYHIDECTQIILSRLEEENFSKVCPSKFKIIIDAFGVSHSNFDKKDPKLYPKNITLEYAKEKIVSRVMFWVETDNLDELKVVAQQYNDYANGKLDIYAVAELGDYKKLKVIYEKGKIVEIDTGETIEKFED